QGRFHRVVTYRARLKRDRELANVAPLQLSEDFPRRSRLLLLAEFLEARIRSARMQRAHQQYRSLQSNLSRRRSGSNPLITCQDQPPFAPALRSVDLPGADPMLDKP